MILLILNIFILSVENNYILLLLLCHKSVGYSFFKIGFGWILPFLPIKFVFGTDSQITCDIILLPITSNFIRIIKYNIKWNIYDILNTKLDFYY